MKVKRLRYNRRKVFLCMFLLLFLFCISIGYAFLNTNLVIKGTTKITKSEWNIHFSDFNPIKGSVNSIDEPVIEDTSVTFSARLEDPGDFYGFTIDVVNEGSFNAAISSISVTPDFNDIGYIDANFSYSDNTPFEIGDVLRPNAARTLKVKLKYKEGINNELYPKTDQAINVTFTINYEQYTGEIVSGWTLPNGKDKDHLEIGDEICARDECFYFIRYDGNDIIMLSKYNLKVGKVYDLSWGNFTYEYTEEDDNYGLQDSEMRGFLYDFSGQDREEQKGVVPFSQTKYWEYNPYGLKSEYASLLPTNAEYGDTFPVDVYDSVNYVGEPETENYSIAYYVEQYRNRLNKYYNVYINKARLLTYSEATDNIGCSGYTCPTTGDLSFISYSSFWLGTVNAMWGNSLYNTYGLYTIDTAGYFALPDYDNYDDSADYGVRPVLVVSKADF